MLGGGFLLMDRLNRGSDSNTIEKMKSKKVFLPTKITKDDFYQQRNVGNCYFLAAMDAVIHSDKSNSLLSRIDLTKDCYSDGEKKYHIQFPTGKKSEVSSLELGQSKKQLQPVSGSKYMQLLELAYLRIVQKLRGSNQQEFSPNNVNDDVFEIGRGGFSNEALKEMFGGRGDTIAILREKTNGSFDLKNEKNITDFLKKVNRDLANTYLLTASTPARSETESEIVTEYEGQKINFPLQHAYSIRGFNSRKNEITVSNPHDSALEVYKLPVSVFCKVFERLNYFKLPNSDISW